MDADSTENHEMTRREYLKTSAFGVSGLFVAPAIIPNSVLGKSSPNDMINVGQIGCGRIARGHDLPETMKEMEDVRVVAVSDVDRQRMKDGKALVEEWYAEETGKENYVDVQTYQDYREMLAQSNIDAVIVSTPDHWHAQPVVEAALAGKDIYMQKPHSLTVREGRIMADVLQHMGTVFQVGSQQRGTDPWPQFKRACELVRNGRVGPLQRVDVGLPGDPSGGDPTPMPVPENLNYDMWLGRTSRKPYTQQRVHPQSDNVDERYSRPGWLRCEQFSAGMITGWGAHHVDAAHWGMGTEYTGPVEIQAEAEFPEEGLWDVHGKFRVESQYENGVTMIISNELEQGVRFTGAEDWIHVSRGPAQVTASDPGSGDEEDAPLKASTPSLLNSEIGPDELHLQGRESEEHHSNWVRKIKEQDPDTLAPAEVSHRSTSACLLSHIAMKLPRTLHWDPANERFEDDDEANSMLSRPQRYPWGIDHIDDLELDGW